MGPDKYLFKSNFNALNIDIFTKELLYYLFLNSNINKFLKMKLQQLYIILTIYYLNLVTNSN
jgi:hypothetical protein